MHRGVQWGKRFHFVINNGALEAVINDILGIKLFL